MQVARLDHQHRSGAAKHADKQEQNGSDWETITAQTECPKTSRAAGSRLEQMRLEAPRATPRRFVAPAVSGPFREGRARKRRPVDQYSTLWRIAGVFRRRGTKSAKFLFEIGGEFLDRSKFVSLLEGHCRARANKVAGTSRGLPKNVFNIDDVVYFFVLSRCRRDSGIRVRCCHIS